MSSTTVGRRELSSRSRYQSISARIVRSNSRCRAPHCSCSSSGTIRRTASTTASSGERSGKPRGGGSPFEPRENSSHHGGGSPLSGGRVVCRGSVIGSSLESHAERTVLELRPTRAVRGHRGRQDDSPLLGSHPDDHLEPDLLQLDVRLLDERHGQAQRGGAVL